MKKAIVAILIISAVLFACGKISTLPTGVLEGADGGADCVDLEQFAPDYTACFSFENGTTNNLATAESGFTAMANSSDRAYKGLKSLKLDCAFTGTNNLSTGKGALRRITGPGTTMNLTGKTVKFRVWVPQGMFETSVPYGANIFVLDNTWKWYQSEWVNLTLPSPGVAGVWNEFSALVDTMHADNGATTMTAVVSDAAYSYGIQISKGGDSVTGSANYTGPMYIDSITVE